MGRVGTLLFIPFILLVSGFLIAFFYWVVKSGASPKKLESSEYSNKTSHHKAVADTSSAHPTTENAGSTR